MSVIAVFGSIDAGAPSSDPNAAGGDALSPDPSPGIRRGDDDLLPPEPDRGRPGEGDPTPPVIAPDRGLPGTLDPVPSSPSPGTRNRCLLAAAGRGSGVQRDGCGTRAAERSR